MPRTRKNIPRRKPGPKPSEATKVKTKKRLDKAESKKRKFLIELSKTQDGLDEFQDDETWFFEQGQEVGDPNVVECEFCHFNWQYYVVCLLGGALASFCRLHNDVKKNKSFSNGCHRVIKCLSKVSKGRHAKSIFNQ